MTGRLSGGQQKQVEFARALMPELRVVLDLGRVTNRPPARAS